MDDDNNDPGESPESTAAWLIMCGAPATRREAIRVLQIRYAPSPDGPWGEPFCNNVEHIHGPSEWSEARPYHLVIVANNRVARQAKETSRKFLQTRVVEYVPLEPAQVDAVHEAELSVICAASILVRDGEERPGSRPRLVDDVRAALRDLSRVEATAQRARRGALSLSTGDDTPWPVRECLLRLADAANHLLVCHNCDCHGHETIRHAINAARALLAVGAGCDAVPAATVDEPYPPHCPTCDSPDPKLHPAVQHEGEVSICPDAFHGDKYRALGEKLAVDEARRDEAERLLKRIVEAREFVEPLETSVRRWEKQFDARKGTP